MALPAFRGDRLRVARMAAGITEEELAGRLGLSSGVRIQAWESGIVERPRPRFLPPLAAELGIDPMSLLDVDLADPPLAALRLVAGHRMQDVSELTGMHPMTYQRLESTGRTGRRLPLTDELIGRLAAAFGTSPANVWAALEASRRPLS